MAQFGNRMFLGRGVPGLLGGMSTRPSLNFGGATNWKPPMGGPTNYPGIERPMPTMGQPQIGAPMMPAQLQPPVGGATNYPGIESPLPPGNAYSISAGFQQPGGMPPGNVFPGERPGTYGIPRPRGPVPLPRNPRIPLMRGM